MARISYGDALIIGAFLECVMYGEYQVPSVDDENSGVIAKFVV